MKSKFNSIRCSLTVAAGLAAGTFSGHTQTATATISGVAAGSSFNYTITLHNTGTLALNSFWYGWTVVGNNLPSNPLTASNSLGWSNELSGNSIMWINGSGTALAPGASATFTFVSSSSPSAITKSPSGESVAYVGQIDCSQSVPGDSTPVFSPTLVSGPLPPVIIEQPQSQTVLTNATVMFSVTASNATSYQWESNLVEIPGQTNDSLTLSNVVVADSATYRVIVSNATSSVVSSNAVLLVLTAALPDITTQPQSTNALTNTTVSLSVTASNAEFYQWEKNLADLSGKTNASLTLSDVVSADSGSYQVIVSNASGAVTSSTAVLAVGFPVKITKEPASMDVSDGTPVTLEVQATGSPAPQYQWFWNDSILPGQTNADLALGAATTNIAGAYSVLVSNVFGTQMSSNAVLTVTPPAAVTKNKLVVTINPAKSGTVAPNLNGETLLVGHSYTVKAMAGRGQVFANWSGIAQSDDPSLTFVMPSVSGATLTANFIPSPFDSNGVAGVYAGLFLDTNDLSDETSGWFSATVAGTGVVDGSVKIAGVATTFATTLHVDGSAVLELPRHNQASLVLTLQVDLSGAETISGTVSDTSNTFNAQLTAYRAGFSSSDPATGYEGYYTWAMPAGPGIAPGGNSFGAATIAANGGVQLSLNLGDGTTATAAGALSMNGWMPLYVTLYNGHGSFLAWLSFNKSSLTTNSAYWFKNPIALFKTDASGKPVPVIVTTGLFPDGFTLTNLSLFMAAYTPEPKGENAVGASSVTVQLSGADLTNSVTNTIAVNSAGSGGSSISTLVSISDKTGLFSGSFKDPISGTTAHYQGALLRPWQTGYGTLISGGLNGAVVIVPGGAPLPGIPGGNVEVSPQFNQDNNILIADQWNNRVIEATPSGRIVWSFGLGPLDFTSNSIVACNDAERVGDYTLMAGTGDVAGVIPQSPRGWVDNRVIFVDPAGQVVWQYGQFGQTGDGPNLLNTPVQCTFVPDFNVLITDQGNNRIIEVNYEKEITWQYPGADTNASDQLNGPNSAELLANGHILIADQGNSRALEVTVADEIVKTFTAGGTVNTLAFASRLENGNTLLTDAGNARIVEVNAKDQVVWQYFTDTNSLSVAAPMPTRAVRLRNGDTLISDQLNNRVLRVNHAKVIVANYGLPLESGSFFGINNNAGYGLFSTQAGLYSPYDAKIIGDYTGLTPPLAP